MSEPDHEEHEESELKQLPLTHINIFDGDIEADISARHLDFISTNHAGDILLGASNLNNRYWNGMLIYVPEAQTDRKCSVATLSLPHGVSEGKILSNNKIVVGNDAGEINVFVVAKDEESEGSYEILHDAVATEHDNSVISLSTFSDSEIAITGSTDCGVKVWNLESMQSLHTYQYAHASCVTSVEFSKMEKDIFYSTGYDGYTLLWDSRMTTPATELLQNDVGYSGLGIFDSVENTLLVGSCDGTISTVDRRKPGEEIIPSFKCSNRAIHRLAAFQITSNSKTQNRYVAVCSDSAVVKILQFDESLREDYCNTAHSDFVRGIAWDNVSSRLYSCGWDTRVISHTHLVDKKNV